MNKSEFLNILREQLTDSMPASEIYSNIQYYDNYISRAIASGKSEEEVMDELGDPRLIAKTLIDADEGPVYSQTYEETWYDDSGNPQSESTDDYSEDNTRRRVHTFDLSAWYNKLLMVLLAIVFIFLVITVARVLFPVAIVLIAIGVISSLFRNHRR